MRQAASVAVGLGMPGLPLALVPGHVTAQSATALERQILEVTVEQVIASLTRTPESAPQCGAEPRAEDIVFTGGYTAVNRRFVQEGWSDGLPIVPPTRQR